MKVTHPSWSSNESGIPEFTLLCRLCPWSLVLWLTCNQYNVAEVWHCIVYALLRRSLLAHTFICWNIVSGSSELPLKTNHPENSHWRSHIYVNILAQESQLILVFQPTPPRHHTCKGSHLEMSRPAHPPLEYQWVISIGDCELPFGSEESSSWGLPKFLTHKIIRCNKILTGLRYSILKIFYIALDYWNDNPQLRS